jgi:hypothetical protein
MGLQAFSANRVAHWTTGNKESSVVAMGIFPKLKALKDSRWCGMVDVSISIFFDTLANGVLGRPLASSVSILSQEFLGLASCKSSSAETSLGSLRADS